MTVVAGLRERKKARTREALRDAAMELFSRQGFDGTTVEEIADACEVSPRTFFRYFPTKEDVLFGDSEQRCGALIEVLAVQPLDVAPLEAIHAAMRGVARNYDGEREALVTRARVLEGSPGLRAYKVEQQRGWEDALVEELGRRSRSAGTFLAPYDLRLLTSVSMAAFRAAFDVWLDEADQADLVALLDEGFRHISGGLGQLGS
jgi:AcrR family transcriptional regulator